MLELLSRLIGRQVWKDKNQWDGFLLCVRNTAPASFPVLLQLPTSVLEVALSRLPPPLAVALGKFINSSSCKAQVRPACCRSNLNHLPSWINHLNKLRIKFCQPLRMRGSGFRIV